MTCRKGGREAFSQRNFSGESVQVRLAKCYSLPDFSVGEGVGNPRLFLNQEIKVSVWV